MKKTATLLSLLLVYLAFQIPTVLRYVWAAFVNPVRALQIALAYDRFLNTVGNGSNRESISSRANRARSEGRWWGCKLCIILDEIQKDHCKNSEDV